jgi:hypothetical protein
MDTPGVARSLQSAGDDPFPVTKSLQDLGVADFLKATPSLVRESIERAHNLRIIGASAFPLLHNQSTSVVLAANAPGKRL